MAELLRPILFDVSLCFRHLLWLSFLFIYLFYYYYFYPHPRTFFSLLLRWGERDRHWFVAFLYAPTWVCALEGKLNSKPFSPLDNAPTNWAPPPTEHGCPFFLKPMYISSCLVLISAIYQSKRKQHDSWTIPFDSWFS